MTDITTKTYAKLTERNDHEGETWHFWIPMAGNEDALTRVTGLLDPDDDEAEYQLNQHPTPEFEVDILVKHDESRGYMPAHTKLAGQLVIPDDFDVDRLYKGGIRDLMLEQE